MIQRKTFQGFKAIYKIEGVGGSEIFITEGVKEGNERLLVENVVKVFHAFDNDWNG